MYNYLTDLQKSCAIVQVPARVGGCACVKEETWKKRERERARERERNSLGLKLIQHRESARLSARLRVPEPAHRADKMVLRSPVLNLKSFQLIECRSWKKHSVSRLSYLFAHLHLLSSHFLSCLSLSISDLLISDFLHV